MFWEGNNAEALTKTKLEEKYGKRVGKGRSILEKGSWWEGRKLVSFCEENKSEARKLDMASTRVMR